MNKEDFKKKDLVLEYTNGVVRVKKNKQIKKFISRNYPKGKCLASVFELEDGDVVVLTVENLLVSLRSCKTLLDLSLEEVSKGVEEGALTRVFSTNKKTKKKVAKLMAFSSGSLEKHRTSEGLFFSVDLSVDMDEDSSEEDDDLFANF